uniref:Putative secreted protein n=1 Tax=Rhipicephalus microplus TaxID=6941 RepID=A0A6M2DBN9_RHIMP
MMNTMASLLLWSQTVAISSSNFSISLDVKSSYILTLKSSSSHSRFSTSTSFFVPCLSSNLTSFFGSLNTL